MTKHLIIELEPIDEESYRVESIRDVVMCRDCVHYRPDDEQRNTPPRCTGVFAFVKPDPEGFCAWGRMG